MPDELNFERAQYIKDSPGGSMGSPEIAGTDSDGIEPERKYTYTQSILLGTVAAVVGSVLYAVFTIATHIDIGYVALGVGYLVGKAIMAGCSQRGGRVYQILAVILTYLAVSMTSVTKILWGAHQSGMRLDRISTPLFLVLAEYGFASPLLRLKGGFGGVISLLILFIALRTAWRLTSARAIVASHPFTAS